jgi:peptidoglycan/LPS O-acetylase OafA/YrhL
MRLSWLAYAGALLLFGGLACWQLGLYAALLSVATSLAINSITFRIPVLFALGTISFSLYLVHGIMATTAGFVLVKLVPPTTDASKLTPMAACLLVAARGSFLFYTLVGKPFLRMASPPRRQV